MKDVYMLVHEFVKTCQSTNGAKFIKTVAPLIGVGTGPAGPAAAGPIFTKKMNKGIDK